MEKLSKASYQHLSGYSNDSIFSYPEKVLQFGTGVLLRALPDYYIDLANKQQVFEGRVVMVKSTPGKVDPAFQMQVLNHLSSLHEQPSVGQPNVQESVPNNVQEDYGNLPPEVRQELEEMRQFRASFAEQQEQFQMEQELELEEAQIRQAYPHYSDSDIENIYNLAFATEGDLLAAQEMYHQMEQGMLNKYLQSKQIPQGATSPSGGPVSVPGKSFGSLDDAHKAAMEMVRNLQ